MYFHFIADEKVFKHEKVTTIVSGHYNRWRHVNTPVLTGGVEWDGWKYFAN